MRDLASGIAEFEAKMKKISYTNPQNCISLTRHFALSEIYHSAIIPS